MKVIIKDGTHGLPCKVDMILDVDPSETKLDAIMAKVQEVVGHPMEFSSNQRRLFPTIKPMVDDGQTLSEYLPRDELELTLLPPPRRFGPRVEDHQKLADKVPDKKGNDQPESLTPIKITIKPFWGQPPFILFVSPNDTIRNVKLKIEDMWGRPLAQQRLIFNRKRLDVDKTISDSNIQDGDTIILMIHLAGPGQPGEPV